MSDIHFTQGTLYNRRQDIHARYGGQQQGGICTPKAHPLIFIFTGESGEQHGYSDGITDSGTYRYFGEGQVGDMEFKSGNRAIRDHLRDGKDLLMFHTLGRRGVRYMGQFSCCGHSFEQAPDRDGNQRRAIMFELMPADGEMAPDEAVKSDVAVLPPPARDLAEMRERAIAAAEERPQSTGKAARGNYYRRSQVVRDYVLARADGVCEGCGNDAPFTNSKGQLYLEPHHIRRLTDGGPDDPRFMAALCPNCHREVHHGANGTEINRRVQEVVTTKESE